MDEAEIRREFSRNFLALGPDVSYPKHQSLVAGVQLKPSHAPLAYLSNACRDPTSIEPWERLAPYRSLRAATVQSRAYNMDVPKFTIPQSFLQDVIQDAMCPDMITSRRNLMGCRVATIGTNWGKIILAASGARGDVLAVTSEPDDDAMQQQTFLCACMECTLFDIVPASYFCLGTRVPVGTLQQHPATVDYTQVAVKHALGISIIDLAIPAQVSRAAPHMKPDVSPTFLIPAAMQVAAILWNPFIAGELVYACGDLSLYSLLLPRKGVAHHNGSLGASVSDRVVPQPRRVVRALAGTQQMLSKHPVALAFVAHPRRIYMASGSAIFFADIPYAAANPQKPRKWKQLINIDPTFGNVTCLQAAPWCNCHTSAATTAASTTSDDKFSYAPLREHLRHIIFVSCSQRLLAYDVRNAGTPILSTATPRTVGEAGFLHVELRECLVPFPAQHIPSALLEHVSTDAPEANGTVPIAHKKKKHEKRRRRQSDAAANGASAQMPHQLDGTQRSPRESSRHHTSHPRAVVALGHMTAACRATGQLFTIAVALAPPLRGLLLRQNVDGNKRMRSGAVDIAATSDAHASDDKDALRALVNETISGERVPGLRIDPVLLPTVRVKAGEPPTASENGAGNGYTMPWSFSQAAAAVFFGRVQVFGFPLRAHLQADAMAMPSFAAAEMCVTAPAAPALQPAAPALQRGDGAATRGRPDADGSDTMSDDEGEQHGEGALEGGAGPGGAAPQGMRYRGEDMALMLQTSVDSLGAVFEWIGRGADGDSSGGAAGASEQDGTDGGRGMIVARDVPEDDLIEGARLLERYWAAGDGVQCFNELMSALPHVRVVRGLITGSVVVEEFSWGQLEVGVWPLPQKLKICHWQPGLHMDDSEMRRAVKMAGMPSRREVKVHKNRPKRLHVPVASLADAAEDLRSWTLPCTTCTEQLEGWWGLWSSEPLSFNRAMHWHGAAERHTAGAVMADEAGAGMADELDDSSEGGGEDEASRVHCWPFDGVHVDNSGGDAPAVVAAALSELMPHIHGALSVADLWASVLMVHARVTGGKDLEEAEQELSERPRKNRGWRQNASRKMTLVDAGADLPDHECSRRCPREKGYTTMYYLEADDEDDEDDEDEEDEERVKPMTHEQARERVMCLLAGGVAAEYLQAGEVPKPLPGRVIGAASRVYSGINRNAAVPRKPEHPDVLLQFGLPHGDGGGVAEGDGCDGGIGPEVVLAWVVHGLRGMGEACQLQLHRMSHPWWLDEARLTAGGHVGRRMVIRECSVGVRDEAALPLAAGGAGGMDGGKLQRPGCDLSQWVLLPVTGKQARRVSVKSRHQLQMGPADVEDVEEEVMERLHGLLSGW